MYPSQAQRFFGWVYGKFNRIRNKPITLGVIISTTMTVAALAVVGIAPEMRKANGYWLSLAAWGDAIRSISIPAIIAALYLKFSEKWGLQQRPKKIVSFRQT